MRSSSDEYDFFDFYACVDNASGWVEKFLDALVEEYRRLLSAAAETVFSICTELSSAPL